jgi:histone H3/H4
MPDSDNDSGGPSNTGGELSSPREQDRFLPIANVSRIMKKALPANAKISKDAKETVQECVSEFISFVTGEASDKCQREKRKTINGDDLLWAMATLGFEEYIEPLKVYLHKFREVRSTYLGCTAKIKIALCSNDWGWVSALEGRTIAAFVCCHFRLNWLCLA